MKYRILLLVAATAYLIVLVILFWRHAGSRPGAAYGHAEWYPPYYPLIWFVALPIALIFAALIACRRYMVPLGAAASLLAACYTAWLWHSSWMGNWTVCAKYYFPPAVTSYDSCEVPILSCHGGLQLQFRSATYSWLPGEVREPPRPGLHVDYSWPQLRSSRYPVNGAPPDAYVTPQWLVRHVGIQLFWRQSPWEARSVTDHPAASVTIPHWFLLLLCLPFPLLSLRRHLRQRHRRKHSLCPTCGYDLRAHLKGGAGPNCPECGTPIPSPSQPSAAPTRAPDAATAPG